MKHWPDRRLLDLFGIEIPIIQAPMAGPGTLQLAIAVSEAGGLGSLPCAQLSVEQARAALALAGPSASRPLNLNFFCHTPPAADAARSLNWRARLAPYYAELGLDAEAALAPAARRPFDAMGLEAGGHRGNFLADDLARQVGTFALVPQVADAVTVPVIAAGGIADARGVVAAFALGAAAVQIGTAYLFCPEANVPRLHLEALRAAGDDDTMVTNVFTGRPARGVANRLMRELGPISSATPEFPLAASALAPLKTKSEAAGSGDFTHLWSGQSARLARRSLPAGQLTQALAREALASLAGDPAQALP